MRKTFYKVLVSSALILASTYSALAMAKTRRLIVEFPSDLPKIAQEQSEDMCLHETGDGRTLLYLEQDQGKALSILDVTDPATIRVISKVEISAVGPFNFAQSIGDSKQLIRYRDGSGFALLDLQKIKQPKLMGIARSGEINSIETLASDGLLVRFGSRLAPVVYQPRDYQVIDLREKNTNPLATISNVQHRLDRTETGTLFLLNKEGLTIVRQPEVEEEYQTHLRSQETN